MAAPAVLAALDPTAGVTSMTVGVEVAGIGGVVERVANDAVDPGPARVALQGLRMVLVLVPVRALALALRLQRGPAREETRRVAVAAAAAHSPSGCKALEEVVVVPLVHHYPPHRPQ